MLVRGFGLPLVAAGGERELVARLTGRLRSGEGRSSLSEDPFRLREKVGGTGEPLTAPLLC
jgi:hypothetical protein